MKIFFLVEMLDYEPLRGLGCIELLFNSYTQLAPGTSDKVLFGCSSYYLETSVCAKSAAM